MSHAPPVGLVLTLIYLLIARSHPWALAMLITLGTILVTLAGRSGDAITTGVTITVVMVVAELEPRNAWEQPILRFADTILGVLVGVAMAWLLRRAVRRCRRHGALWARPFRATVTRTGGYGSGMEAPEGRRPQQPWRAESTNPLHAARFGDRLKRLETACSLMACKRSSVRARLAPIQAACNATGFRRRNTGAPGLVGLWHSLAGFEGCSNCRGFSQANDRQTARR